MNFSDRAFELADVRAEQERETAIRAASARLAAGGTPACIECGRDIPTERREAAPFARRCLECQTIHEQEKYHR